MKLGVPLMSGGREGERGRTCHYFDFRVQTGTCSKVFKTGCLLGNLLKVVLISTGDLSVVDLFLPPLQNGFIVLRVGRIQEARVAATQGRPGGKLDLSPLEL